MVTCYLLWLLLILELVGSPCNVLRPGSTSKLQNAPMGVVLLREPPRKVARQSGKSSTLGRAVIQSHDLAELFSGAQKEGQSIK